MDQTTQRSQDQFPEQQKHILSQNQPYELSLQQQQVSIVNGSFLDSIMFSDGFPLHEFGQ